ncbi:hypothetical protein KW795_01255, partial [Candidatus Microgenomates bacterium]|nr:hypothetical protein [Candidatus Microgenomates bacterium]
MQKLLKLVNTISQSHVVEELLKYSVAAILLAVPLYPKFPFIKIPGTYVSIRLEDFVVLFASLVWFIYILPNIKNLLKDKLFLAVTMFWLVGLVSVIS